MKRSCLLLVIAALAALVGCRRRAVAGKPDPLREAYDTEADWNTAGHRIALDYQQAQGKRLFNQYCVWCHADSTPAGPSNRSNLTPMPALMDDGTVLNSMSDGYLANIITLGGSALGKSAMMPPYGRTLTQPQIAALIAFARAIASPPYHQPGRPSSAYRAK